MSANADVDLREKTIKKGVKPRKLKLLKKGVKPSELKL